MDQKLKDFILSCLRKTNSNLFNIIKSATIHYRDDQMMSFSWYNPKCEFYFSDYELFQKITSNQYKYINELEPIIAIAKNIEPKNLSSMKYYPIDLSFKFDLTNREDVNIANINENLWPLKLDKDKMIKKYEIEDYDWAISSAKSLLESAFKIYLDRNSIPYTSNNDFPTLSKLVFSKIETPKNYYKTIFNWMKTICGGVNETRNKEWDSHGINPEKRPIIDPIMVKVILETTISITYFIINE